METDIDQTWQAWARGDPLEVIDFGGDPDPHVDSGSLSFSSPLRNRGRIFGHNIVSISHANNGQLYHTSTE